MKKWIVLMGLVAVTAAADKPNIIVIMADDMGFEDTGFTGSKDILTPHLDNIADSGVVFKQGYANHPFCGPSRAALLSGRYQHRFGFETNPAYDPSNPIMGIDPGEVLFPERLQKAGYVTGGIGKWHLGAADAFHPNKRGFDYFYGFLGGGHDYFRIDLSQPVKEAYLQGLVRNKRPADFEGYLTTALSRDAVSFVETNKDKPFFLYLAYNCPHAPQQAPEEDVARYSHIEDKKRRVYCAMVDVMDRGIGEVVDALKQNGIYENTLIFFLSDNGGPQSSPKQPGKGNGSSNAPFRGGKGNLYDGGVHVPFIASWPAKIKGGQVFEYPVQSLDIARTAVAVAGADASYGPAMEGVNLIPFVTGKNKGAPAEAIFWRGGDGANWSVLASDGTKHLVDHDTKKPELYFLPDDVSEANDILSKQPERAKELYAQWKKWDADNVPCRLMGYKAYHKNRDQFFAEAIPGDAKKAGYRPKVKATFK
ncbi:sulfatase-like hydrolase/transferase [Pontiella sulfatireligans]|uniref:Arylsulfatase n=1 Tax=Pontiella sulfatireligans TaxID=2750658 RepID=A0A6C2UT69_9BACT|nr:sulfatase-like hydrolase/transferase [Pontiella sulfatireligans]SPS74504.1 sulfatase S1_19 [Kiritimatiellales bacterium]VGO22407.1 Arylsulfatase [Pontiella sulfatireligans]